MAVALVAAGCTLGAEPSGLTGTGVSADELMAAACADTSHEVLLRTWRGVRPDRGGDIQIIPVEPSFVSGGLTHATPFDHTQEVPLLLYGPGVVRTGTYGDPVTLADLAPTLGAVLGFPFDTRDGTAQTQALLPPRRREPPRLLVTVVWDSAGMNVLRRWPDAWPFLARLAGEGAWFTSATVGASPSNTPTGHSIIGTGTFPRTNGFVDEFIRLNGLLEKPNLNGPGFLLQPTLADLYDPAMGNAPKVGAIGTLSAHIMMMGHSLGWGGGDRDLAVTREQEDAPTAGAETGFWNLTDEMAPFYQLPAYVNDLPPLSEYLGQLDRADGRLDGAWRGHDLARYADGFNTPARTPFQETLVETVIAREGFGADGVPDLLFLNYKAIDVIGHLFSADGIEMSDAVKAQDDALRRLVRFLDSEVGAGRWVMAVVADHGTQNDPRVSGAFEIDLNALEAGLAAAFDADGDARSLVQKIRPTEIWLDAAELRDNGVGVLQVAGWLSRLTQADTAKPNRTPTDPSARVFSAVVPSRILSQLPCLPEARAG
jgi:predicted AlkP superfamily pyrophosphatase or phosphodiesterase